MLAARESYEALRVLLLAGIDRSHDEIAAILGQYPL